MGTNIIYTLLQIIHLYQKDLLIYSVYRCAKGPLLDRTKNIKDISIHISLKKLGWYNYY